MATNSSYYGYDYFCGANVYVNINGLPALEVAGISYQVQDSTSPIYGYSSRIFDAIAIGQKIVRGAIIINFIQPHYLSMLIERGRGVSVKNKVEEDQIRSQIDANYQRDQAELDALQQYITARESAYQNWITHRTYNAVANLDSTYESPEASSEPRDPFKAPSWDPVSFQSSSPDQDYLTGRELIEQMATSPQFFLYKADGSQINVDALNNDPRTFLQFTQAIEGSQVKTNYNDTERTIAQELADKAYQRTLDEYANVANLTDNNKTFFDNLSAQLNTDLMKGAINQYTTYVAGRHDAASGNIGEHSLLNDSFGRTPQEEVILDQMRQVYQQKLQELTTQKERDFQNDPNIVSNSYVDKQQEIAEQIERLQNAPDNISASKAMAQLDGLEKAYMEYNTASTGIDSTFDPGITTDIGLLGPFNIDIHYAKSYTIRIIDAFFTSRGSQVQIDESALVEEYSFFARDIKSISNR